MQSEAFRDWLRQKGLKKNSLNTRVNGVRRVEVHLGDLGIAHADLDSALAAGQFEQIQRALDDLLSDARAGGVRYRALFPESEKPSSRIPQTKFWLSQYAKFFSEATESRLSVASSEGFWILGAAFDGVDQLPRFIKDGVWEIKDPTQAESVLVNRMKAGDHLAIKATFVQKNNLPFENHGKHVSVMRLKARGQITENPENGSSVMVRWEQDFEPKDWYFYTYRATIWDVRPGTPLSDRLIEFSFFDEPQDLDFFLNFGEWAGMYSTDAAPQARRYWIEKSITTNRQDRQSGEHAVGRALWSPKASKDGRNIYANMLDVRPGDIVFHLTDNTAITDVSVVANAADENFIGLAGTEWEGQPGYRVLLQDHEVMNPPLDREDFLNTEPFAGELRELYESGAKGLFFNSRGLNQGAYLTEATPTLLSILNRAYFERSGKALPYVSEEIREEPEPEGFTLDDALKAVFLERHAAEDILSLWRAKRNVILQGPPGVGKSFLAQRLAFALMGREDRTRLGFVQFHQSYSYEDFVEGYRPTEMGFELKAGKFVEFCRRAESDPSSTFVFIIDEINRGNLSKIFGELMLLIENDKRDSNWAMPLASSHVKFYVPDNVFILGLMNTADRSLAVVDYALRRRFAFVDLEPAIGAPSFKEHLASLSVPESISDELVRRITRLNLEISKDLVNLGPGFMIGHSYFCEGPVTGETATHWYGRIARTEIIPLLKEYWFDVPQKFQSWQDQLLEPFE